MKLIFIFLLFLGNASVYAKSIDRNTVILVLGCHMNDILEDRMTTAVKFARGIDTPITWFLSGGTKNQIDGIINQNEADDMAYFVSNSNSKWNIELDTKATNTAENFAYFRKWLEQEKEYAEIYVVTSEFHHLRASSIMNGIISNPVKWILGSRSCTWCIRDEGVHIRNVSDDIEKALRVYNTI